MDEFSGAKFSISVSYADSDIKNVSRTIADVNLPAQATFADAIATDVRTFARMLVNMSKPNAQFASEPKLAETREVVHYG